MLMQVLSLCCHLAESPLANYKEEKNPDFPVILTSVL